MIIPSRRELAEAQAAIRKEVPEATNNVALGMMCAKEPLVIEVLDNIGLSTGVDVVILMIPFLAGITLGLRVLEARLLEEQEAKRA